VLTNSCLPGRTLLAYFLPSFTSFLYSAAVCWYPFNSTTGCVVGGKTLTKTLALDEIVMYVRPGTVLTMQRDVVQFSDAIGGVLAVHVYAGADGTFDLVEDDGETLDYAAVGGKRTRRGRRPLRGAMRRARCRGAAQARLRGTRDPSSRSTPCCSRRGVPIQ